MIFFFFLSTFFDCRGSIAESEGDLDGLICILLYRLGFGGSAQFSEVRWRGTLVLSGSNATPVVSDRETSYWSGGVNSACRNLSPPSFKRLKSVMLETSFSRVLGPRILLPRQNRLWSWDGSFLVQSSRSQKDKPEKILKVLGRMGAWPSLCGFSCHWKCFYVMTRRTT